MQGTQGRVSSLPALARSPGQSDNEIIDAEFLVQWHAALPSGLAFLLELLQSNCTLLYRVSPDFPPWTHLTGLRDTIKSA